MHSSEKSSFVASVCVSANFLLHLKSLRFFPYLNLSQRKPNNSKQELKASVQELAENAANLAKAEAAKNIVPPNSAYQFEVSWRGLSSDRALQARLLQVRLHVLFVIGE